MRRLLPLAFLLIVPIALAACGGGGGGDGQASVSQDVPATGGIVLPAPTAATPVTQCDFSKPVSLRTTTKYGIFGDDEFDTLVCG